MYAKQAIAREFWTRFGQYMRPVPGFDGNKVNWINYKTGIPHIYFRLDANENMASVSIELRHPDPEEREQFFRKLTQFKSIFQETIAEPWNWELQVKDLDGNTISRIWKELPETNVYDVNTWPGIISFFKPRIQALDVFWNNIRDAIH